MKNSLKNLQCRGDSTMTQKEIQNLNKLEKLNISDNLNITCVNHLKNTLRVLHCERESGIEQKSIQELKKIEIF